MLRRSLLSMLLGKSTIAELTSESATRIDMPAYLKTACMVPLVQQVGKVLNGERIELAVSTAHAFSISWSFCTAASNTTSLQFGVKADVSNPQPPIDLGFHPDGFLYIGNIEDKRRLTLQKLNQPFQLLLEVHPQVENLSYAKLTLKDPYGLTLSMVKNRTYSSSAWAGTLINLGCSLAHLSIEGITLK